MSDPPTVGSLFSGVGGLDLGLERAGFEVRWQVEWDQSCLEILERHWPEVPKYEDVQQLSSSTLETVDLISGGFPCQPVSVSGKRKGTSDPRWLWPHFARLVGELRPQYVLVENVPALTSQGGAEVLADLVTLGYNAEWHHLPAGAFGATHLRWRFFLVAHSGSTAPQLANAARGQEWVAPIPLQPEGVSPQDWQVDAEGRLANPLIARWEEAEGHPSPPPWIQGMDDGAASRVDRERQIGNAVVPQVAEAVGRWLLASLEEDEEKERMLTVQREQNAKVRAAQEKIGEMYADAIRELGKE